MTAWPKQSNALSERPPRQRHHANPRDHRNRRASADEIRDWSAEPVARPSDKTAFAARLTRGRNGHSQSANDEGGNVPLAIAGTGYGLIGILVIVLLVVLILYFVRRA